MKKIYVVGLIIVCILSIGIVLVIFTEKKDLEKKEDEENMTSFEWYQFIELRQMQNSKKPFSTHLIWEHSTYGIYFVDSTDQTVLLKTTDKGVTVSTVDLSDNTNSYKIQAGYLDGNDLWLVMCDNPGDDFEVCYIEMDDSDDCNPITVSAGADNGTVYAWDIYELDGDHYVLNTEERAATGLSVIWDVDANPFVEIDTNAATGGGTDVFTQGIEVTSTTMYFLWDYGIGLYYLIHDSNADTWGGAGFFITGYSLSSNLSQRNSHAFDEDQTIYFVSEKDADGKDYLLTYDITTVDFTVHDEYNIAFMLDRNCAGTANSPFQYEKGFHITSSFVYQLHRDSSHVWKLQDLGLTGGETIIAITDHYLITSNSDLYEYTESIANMPIGRCTYGIYKPPVAEFSYQTSLSTDQLIEIYENANGTYTKCFSGRAGIPKYNNRKAQYDFRCVNFGADDLNRPVSKTVSAAGLDETVIALINDNCNYLYADATSVPNIAVSVTMTWEDQTLRDVLYTLCILGNAYWWFEPDGYFYFRAYSNPPAGKLYYGYPDNFNKETVGSITTASNMNFIDTLSLPNSCSAELKAELDGHKNVLSLTHDGGLTDPYLVHSFPNGGETSGIREYYLGGDDVTRDQRTMLRSSAAIKITVSIDASKIYHYPNNVKTDTGVVPVNSQLNHIKIDFDCATDTYDLYIDENLIGGGGSSFQAVATTLDDFSLQPIANAAYTTYVDAFGDPAQSKYTSGDNLYETITQYTGDCTAPELRKLQNQFNTWIIDGGIDQATGKPFTKTETDDDHILLYGESLWKGRDQFPEARTQTDLDAIATGLTNWQGMQDNPDEALIRLLYRYYYPIGRSVYYQFTYLTEFATAQSMLIADVRINFKEKGMVNAHLTTNIVRLR